MRTHDIVFSNLIKTTAEDILYSECKDISSAPNGDYWRQVRKLGVLALLSHKRVKTFQFVREEEVAILVSKICKARLSEAYVLVVNSNNLVVRCVLGRKFEDKNGKSKFGKLARRMMEQLSAFSLGDYFPYLGWIDLLTGLILRLKATFGALDSLLDQVVEEHKAVEIESHQHQSLKKDFVDILLQFQKYGMDGFELTQENLKAILMVSLSLSLSLCIHLIDNVLHNQ